MPPVFLILLATALGSVLACIKTSHEISRVLTAAIAITCLIGGLAIAPWQVQALVVLVLLGTERLYRTPPERSSH